MGRMRFTVAEIADHVQGRVASTSRDIEISGVSIDSRDTLPGQLFVPIVAERDGHAFIDAARANGATAWLVGEGHTGDDDERAIVVADTTRALQELSKLARTRLPDRIVGVTGSVGKTSTKDLIGAILRTRGNAMVSVKSFNNELGVPLTLTNAPDDTWAGVVEMGARGPRHIQSLCELARPSVGVITNVGTAHLEMFGSREVIADSKSELIASLPQHGVAVLNLDSDLYARMATFAASPITSFSASGNPQASVYATDIEVDAELRATFTAHVDGDRFQVSLGARGVHQVENALAAIAATLSVGATEDEIVEGLATSDLSPMRMELVTLPTGSRLLNDTYNANPVSMRAAIDALVQLPAGRRIAFLGPMAELGPERESLHREVASYGLARGVDHIFAVGEPSYGTTVLEDIDAAVDMCRELAIGPLDALLVKGSRVAAMERLVHQLLEGSR